MIAYAAEPLLAGTGDRAHDACAGERREYAECVPRVSRGADCVQACEHCVGRMLRAWHRDRWHGAAALRRADADGATTCDRTGADPVVRSDSRDPSCAAHVVSGALRSARRADRNACTQH